MSERVSGTEKSPKNQSIKVQEQREQGLNERQKEKKAQAERNSRHMLIVCA